MAVLHATSSDLYYLSLISCHSRIFITWTPNNNNNNCLVNHPSKVQQADTARQGRTKSMYRRCWQRLYGPWGTLEHSQQPAWISCVSVVAEGRKPETPKKKPQSRVENQHKFSPHMTLGPGIKRGPHWWEASTLTTASSLLPNKSNFFLT